MIKHAFILSTVLALTLAHASDLGIRAPFEAFGVEKNGLGGEQVADNDWQAGFAPAAQLGEKNASEPMLKDRSLDLVNRQSCQSGYWYCSAFGKCCPRSSLCCSYGYCIDPDDTCCPDGPCRPGWGCCGPNCYPRGGDCCSDNNYCEAGNICVRLSSSNRIVCCTDLKCTAVVRSGSTSYVTTSSRAPATITSPPRTTRIVSVGGVETWRWTVTWWYYSFWWSTFRATSTVTYTRIYSTTTFTTTATDESQARSRFSALSATLTFPVPASAQTSLAALLTQRPTETETFTFGDSPFETGAGDEEPSSAVVITRTASQPTGAANTLPVNNDPNGGQSGSNGLRVAWGLGLLGIFL
ncbi:hypothetical protein K469DRAFT_688587 [Zopfia rhizophila CBS 207.26]|uniref:Carbohydrate-binding module family 18 protein n=1 Tax=Zopfia rhizophila CBS 207.26 TaxID=1314779 RepID=A0A6A6E262_9PEZI|nr:hypothetical protein K469DRAFT_688587 [Zopfia rhizophila CBS 207.26]